MKFIKSTTSLLGLWKTTVRATRLSFRSWKVSMTQYFDRATFRILLKSLMTKDHPKEAAMMQKLLRAQEVHMSPIASWKEVPGSIF